VCNKIMTPVFFMLLLLLDGLFLPVQERRRYTYDREHTLAGHDTLKYPGDVIYTDPFNIKKKMRLILSLSPMEHYDHCSPDDVKKIQKAVP